MTKCAAMAASSGPMVDTSKAPSKMELCMALATMCGKMVGCMQAITDSTKSMVKAPTPTQTVASTAVSGSTACSMELAASSTQNQHMNAKVYGPLGS